MFLHHLKDIFISREHDWRNEVSAEALPSSQKGVDGNDDATYAKIGYRTGELKRSCNDSEDCSMFRSTKLRTEQVPQLSFDEPLCGRAAASEHGISVDASQSPIRPQPIDHDMVDRCIFAQSREVDGGFRDVEWIDFLSP